MAPSRRKASARAAAAAAARQQWKFGDLVLAKMKGFPAWPAMVSDPVKWGYPADRKKLFVYFYGTKQIAFCNHADIEAFTEEKKKSLSAKRQGKGSDFARAVDEIVDVYEKLNEEETYEFNTENKDVISNGGSSENSRVKSCIRSPELTKSIAQDLQSDALYPAAERSDDFSAENVPEASAGGDLCDKIEKVVNEKVSILDQLRQTPLGITATPAQKKRHRDVQQHSCMQERVPERSQSLRRSRGSNSDLGNRRKSNMQATTVEDSGEDLLSYIAPKEFCVKEAPSGEVEEVSISSDVDQSPTKCLASDGICDVSQFHILGGGSESIHSREGNTLESSIKVPEHGNLDKNAKLSGELDIPMNALIIKKKRKPIRKRSNAALEPVSFENDNTLQADRSGAVSEVVSSCKAVSDSETHSKTDGDEHLPLVKRARVRMGKPLAEGMQPDSPKSEKMVHASTSNKFLISSNPDDTCHGNATSSDVKEPLTSSSLVNECICTVGNDSKFWKAKYEQRGMSLDVEAALPLSKRLHRALEAMSANAAEVLTDCSDAYETKESISDGCMDSPKMNPVHFSNDGSIEEQPGLTTVQISENGTSLNTSSGWSSTFITQDMQEPPLNSSEVNPDGIVNGDLTNQKISSKGFHMDVDKCAVLSISKVANTGADDKSMQSDSFVMSEKQVNINSADGMLDQVSSHVVDAMHEISACSGVLKTAGDYETPEPMLKKLASNPAGVFLSVTDASLVSSIDSAATKSSSSQSNEHAGDQYMQDGARQVHAKANFKDRALSPNEKPMKMLIAAAQAIRVLPRSTSFSENGDDVKGFSDPVTNPSLSHREETSEQGTPSNLSNFRTPASDYRTQNGSRSPHVLSRQRGSNKLVCHEESNAARKSFEASLYMLSRTKESIGRATRLAIECAKHGIAGEVVELLLQTLEKEPSLYRRIDLFFLVDSIIQFSRTQKGGAGDVYPSLVQSVLSRLLCAAAPPGNAASENRRQCLKVLRLWLERKTLPEWTIRQHMRELDVVNDSHFACASSRRPSRTERAINDPIREMEGMLVDEYGSNTSFQLPGFLIPRVLEDDEQGSASDEKSFETVTPERNVSADEQNGSLTLSEKHRHILEDVDGELEMEDVAPPCEIEVCSSYPVAGADIARSAHNQHEQQHSLPFVPPLPEDRPPSPPPLPSSPPPPEASPWSPPLHHNLSGGSWVLANGADSQFYRAADNMSNHMPQALCQQPNNLVVSSIPSASVPCYSHAYGSVQRQMPLPVSSLDCSSSYRHSSGTQPTIHTRNNAPPLVCPALSNKAYHVQPPHPVVSNHFSYVQAGPQQRMQSWGNCSSSFNKSLPFVHDFHRGKYYSDRDSSGPIQHEVIERSFSPGIHPGNALLEKIEPSSSSLSFYGAPAEPPQIPCHGWSIPPRASSYGPVVALRPLLETPVSRMDGGHGFWRPR